MRVRPALTAGFLASAVALTCSATVGTGAAAASRATGGLSQAATPELTETSRLDERRALVTGDRFFAMGTEAGRYPATGFHTRGEMGGFWSQPIKLLDGVWFGLGDSWFGPSTSFTSGWGYTRQQLPALDGVSASRVDFVPDGLRAGLVGLSLTSATTKTVTLRFDAHSELMSVYPWGETNPSQLQANLPDTGAFSRGRLVFRDTGTPDVPNSPAHDWTALAGSSLIPSAHQLGPDFRGPQDPAVICPASGPDAPTQPPRCDDTEYGKGTGGQLSYQVKLTAGQTVPIWFAVAGSDQSPAQAQAAYATALKNPAGLLASKLAARRAIAANSQVDLPGDRLLQRSVEWYKQNLADSVQESRNLQLRPTAAGTVYPAPVGTLAKARWIGAGWPDYPWIFGTDGEYTAFAEVAAGQFEPIEAHLRTLRDVSEVVNQRSAKVVHEVTPDGQVYFGANDDPGNTDETAKFPSAVALIWRWTGDNAFRDDLYSFAVRNMRYIYRELDADNDGWPEGLGNVERAGMGEEKLDNTVYTIRGLRDLADLAASKGDRATYQWASSRASRLEKAFEDAWWYGKTADQYADSLDIPDNGVNDNTKIFQRHWIGVTPMDAELVRPGQVTRPLASDEHGQTALAKREEACYTGANGLYHTGTGATTADTGNPGPACDDEVSSVGSERDIFSLNTAIMAVAEGNFGRLGADQQRFYTDANARIQLDPSLWEQPGASPEIAPSPDFGANIDKLFTERSSLLQAWGAYGVLWPVIHQQLGVSPDLGRGRLEVVPQVPPGQSRVAGHSIRLGPGSADVWASASASSLRTLVQVHGLKRVALSVGAVLPSGSGVSSVTLNGHAVRYAVRRSARGSEVVVQAGSGRADLVVHLA